MDDNREQLPIRVKYNWPPVIFLTILLFALAVFVAYRVSLSLRISTRLKAISTAGYPVTADDLDKWYPAVPEKENAALVFTEAFARLDLDSSRTSSMPLFPRNRLPPRTTIIPPDRKKQIADLLEANRRTLELLYSGVGRKKSRYPIELAPGSNRQLPHLDHVRNCVRLLCLEAVLHADAGKLEDAVQSLAASINLAQSLSDRSVLSSEFARIACLNLTCASLERILTQNRLSDAQFLKLLDAFHAPINSPALHRALAGERCFGIQMYESSVRESVGSAASGSTEEFDITSIRSPFGLFLYKASGLFQRDFVFYLDMMEAHIAAAKLPFPEQFVTATNLAARIEEDTAQKYLIVSRMLLPPLATSTTRSRESFARLQATQVGLSIERYRLANADKLPDKLVELIPAFLKIVPPDPFDGRPLRYRKLAKGYVVYSIGSDGSDDAGAERRFGGPGGNPNDPYDITFTVER